MNLALRGIMSFVAAFLSKSSLRQSRYVVEASGPLGLGLSNIAECVRGRSGIWRSSRQVGGNLGCSDPRTLGVILDAIHSRFCWGMPRLSVAFSNRPLRTDCGVERANAATPPVKKIDGEFGVLA